MDKNTTNFETYAVSSRVRLARNIQNMPFPGKLPAHDERLYAAMRKVFDGLAAQGGYEIFEMDKMNELRRLAMKEKHLISTELVESADGAVILSRDSSVSIMLNEEDHIREQCILPGLKLNEAYKIIDGVDDAVSRSVDFSFDKELGYLTACPTNLGTGMRASVMMFLPALTMNQSITQVIAEVSRYNITVRGVFGENSAAEGFMYQVSNQRSLGMTEAEILDTVNRITEAISDAEEKAREKLLKTNEVELTDTVCRAWGLLTNAYKMDTKEFMSLMGQVKLGVALNILKLKNAGRLEDIINDAQPASITLISKRELDAEARDIFRSEYVAKELKKIL